MAKKPKLNLQDFWDKNREHYERLSMQACTLEFKLDEARRTEEERNAVKPIYDELGIDIETTQITEKEEGKLQKRLDEVNAKLAKIEAEEKKSRERLETKNQNEAFFLFLQEYGPEPLFARSRFQEKVRSWWNTKNDPHASGNDRHAARKSLLKIGQVLAGKKDPGARSIISFDQKVRIISKYETLLEEYLEKLGNERKASGRAIADLAEEYNCSKKTVRRWKKQSETIREERERLWKELDLFCPSCGTPFEIFRFPQKDLSCSNPDCDSGADLFS